MASHQGPGGNANVTIQYTRDAAGRLTGTSEASSAATQTRSFSFDWLGRRLSEANPESGNQATQYIYDADSTCGTGANDNGSQVARQDAAGNVTCYLHDAMGRVTSQTHPTIASGFLTPPNAYFVYGAGHSVGGTTMQNAAGRLAEAYTQSGSTLETDEGFSYAADGRLAGTYESTAHDGGFYYWVGDTYAANGTVTEMQNNFGLLAITYALDGEGRWSTGSASSGQNPVTAAQYNVFGEPTEVDLGSGDKDVYGYDAALGRMTGYTFDVGAGALAATLTWNQDGTLGNLTATDTLPGGGGPNAQNCGYGYDDLARLESVNCGAGNWGQTFSTDAFGNMASSGSQGFSATFNLATNRINDLGVSYDADGDELGDAQHSTTWDANQHSASIDGAPVAYDALGNMVEKYQHGAWDQLVRGPQGT